PAPPGSNRSLAAKEQCFMLICDLIGSDTCSLSFTPPSLFYSDLSARDRLTQRRGEKEDAEMGITPTEIPD
ncbi:MAG: hypothetical protein ABI882_22465, partial [Acidobacteriota bacterium]